MMTRKRELQLAAAGIALVGLLVLVARHGSSQPGGGNGSAPISAPINNGEAAGGNGEPAGGAGGGNGGAASNPDANSPGLLARLTHSERSLTLQEGTPVDVRLLDAIGSARNRSGDSFQASLDEPIKVNGFLVVPQGARVTGRVVSARPSGHLQTPAELAVTLTSVDVGGREYEITTSTHSWRGRSHKGHDAKWIGGLTGAGALIGALAGHGKGAAIGAGAGAGAGTLGAYATGKKDITLGPETRLRFVLRQPVSVTKAG